MNYISGKQVDFESRLHELGDSGSLLSFVKEGNSYNVGGNVSRQQSGKWEREAGRVWSRYSPGDTTHLMNSGMPLAPAVNIQSIQKITNTNIIAIVGNVFYPSFWYNFDILKNCTAYANGVSGYAGATGVFTGSLNGVGGVQILNIGNSDPTYLFIATSGDGINCSSKPVSGAIFQYSY